MARTLDLQQAADFLQISKEELRRRAKRGVVQGAKPGKCWAFLEEDLVAYFRSLYSENRQAAPSLQKEAICSTNVVELGGSISQHPTDSELDDLLLHPIEHWPKSFTTSSEQKRGDR